MTIRADNRISKIRSSYDALAEEYAKNISNELDHRPKERDLLQRFAERCRDRGVICDLGCGPGHIARYVRQFNPNAIGLDLSRESLVQAQQRNPEILFLQGDMLALPFASEKLSGVIAFYSIIHFEGPQVDRALGEIQRVLRREGGLLLGFHVGTEIVHVDQVFGVNVDLDARFFTMDDLVSRLKKLGLTVVEKLQREPYPEIEYQSVRGYIWAVKPG
jgi:ubiquinone/menaquinone biosynthesis C-methylase UbiE